MTKMNAFRLTLDSTMRRLLHSVLNEVLNGFALDDFDTVIGKNKTELRKLLADLHDLPEDSKAELDFSQTMAFRNALREAMRELGINEFHTRTGYEFEEGESVLHELDRRLAEG